MINTSNAVDRSSTLAARYLGLGVCVIAVAVMVGWATDTQALKSVSRDFVAMKPNSALALGLLGLAVAGLTSGQVWHTALARAAAVFAAVVGAATLLQMALGVDWGINQLLFREAVGANDTAVLGRPAPETALCLLLDGLALVVLDRRERRLMTPAQGLTLVSGLVAVFVLLGYGLHVRVGTLVVGETGMALHSSVALVCLSAATWLARPRLGVMAIAASETVGGTLVRRVLPVMSATLLLLGWLRVQGQAAGLYGTIAGAEFSTLGGILALALVLLGVARSLSATDAKRTQAEQALQLAHAELAATAAELQRAVQTKDLILQHIPDGLAVVDAHGNYVLANPVVRNLAGGALLAGDVNEHRKALRIVADDGRTPVPIAELPSSRALRGEAQHDVALRITYDDRSSPWVSTTATPMLDDAGAVAGAVLLLRDITAKRAADALLAHTNTELARKNEEVEAFIYVVSHDLRSPLVTIQGFSRELVASVAELKAVLEVAALPPATVHRVMTIIDDDMAGALAFIHAGGGKLERLITALLKLARTGRQDLRRESLDVNDMVAATLSALQSQVRESGATIEVGPLPPAFGDATALGQVFANLISNALNYLQPGVPGLIHVGGESDPTGPHYWVRDNGMGIPDTARSRLFQVFQRFHPEAAIGEGMGLSIVKRLVERHGGRVWVDSVVAHGTTIHITLPTSANSDSTQERSDDSPTGP